MPFFFITNIKYNVDLSSEMKKYFKYNWTITLSLKVFSSSDKSSLCFMALIRDKI